MGIPSRLDSISLKLFSPPAPSLWVEAAVSLDGEPPVKAKLLLLVAANGQYYGGGYRGAPLAKPDDGLLDVVLVRPIPRLKIPGFLARYKEGLHLNRDGELAPEFQPYMSFCRVLAYCQGFGNLAVCLPVNNKL